MRKLRLTIILISIFFIQSCGIKFWYNKLDWMVSWQVDDYVELTSAQEDMLEQIISLKTEWHRSSQLPQYVELLTNIISDVENGNIENNYDAYIKNFSEFYYNIVNELSPEIIPQIASLDDEQVAELINNLNKEANKNFEKSEKIKPEKRFEKLVDNLEDNYQDWLGKLSKSQKSLIKQQAEKLKPTRVLMFEYRRQWREAFHLALQERTQPSGQDALMSLITEPRQLLKNSELKSNLDHNDAIEKEYLLKILASMSEKQKKKVIGKLNNYKDDFEDLIKDK